MPFAQPVEWYGLRTIDQGADLVRIGRIDVLIAHRNLFKGDRLLEAMPFPPVRVVELTLVCHDTPRNREFVLTFDLRVEAALKRHEQSRLTEMRFMSARNSN
jgi:hypothetical protein